LSPAPHRYVLARDAAGLRHPEAVLCRAVRHADISDKDIANAFATKDHGRVRAAVGARAERRGTARRLQRRTSAQWMAVIKSMNVDSDIVKSSNLDPAAEHKPLAVDVVRAAAESCWAHLRVFRRNCHDLGAGGARARPEQHRPWRQ
jgi:hypothetical protein